MASQTPKFQFLLSFDFGSPGFPDVQERESFPLNFDKCKLQHKPNIDIGQIFYRTLFQGTLIFVNNNGAEDFNYFRNIILSNRRCDVVSIKINKWCGSEWEELWIGSFSCINASIDWDRCTLEIKPDVEDKYTCFLKLMEIEMDPAPFTDFPDQTMVGLTQYDGRHLLEMVSTMIETLAETNAPCMPSFVENPDAENNLRSDFFEWNAVGDAIGYAGGINYVTGAQNFWNMLYIYNKSNVIDPDASNPATIKKLSLKTIFFWFKEIFNVLWDFSPIGDLRLEHYSYFQQSIGLDLTAAQFEKELKKMNKHSLIDGQIPNKEIYSWMEAANDDFVGKDITYNTNCVLNTPESKREHDLENVTTDIKFIRDSTLPVIYTVQYVALAGGNFIPGTSIVDDYSNGITGFGSVMADTPPPGLPDFGYLQIVSDRIKIHIGTTITGPGGVTASVTGVSARKQTNISPQGYVLMANYDDGSDIRVLDTPIGPLSGGTIFNSPLSWAVLHPSFHKVNRWYKEGMMNDVLTSFKLNNPTVKQTPLEIKMCCEIFSYDPKLLVKTELGQNYLGGLKARVLESTYNPLRDTLTLTLGYTY